MRVVQLFMFFILFLETSEAIHKIPKRYRKDWRLYCNVCNNYINAVISRLKDSIKIGDEYDIELRFGFRLDSEGKKKSLKKKSSNINKSEIKLSNVLEEHICGTMVAYEVLYNKTSQFKEGVMMLQENQKYDRPKGLGLSSKPKYVGKANIYCADIAQRFYDDIIDLFIRKEVSTRVLFCPDYVDSRCLPATELPEVIFNDPDNSDLSKSTKKRNAKKSTSKRERNHKISSSDVKIVELKSEDQIGGASQSSLLESVEQFWSSKETSSNQESETQTPDEASQSEFGNDAHDEL